MSAVPGMPPEIKTALAKSWKLLLTVGIISAVLGLIAIIVPPLASVTITLLVGILLLPLLRRVMGVPEVGSA